MPVEHGRSTGMADLDPAAVVAGVCARVGDPISRDEWAQYLPDLPYHPPCG